MLIQIQTVLTRQTFDEKLAMGREKRGLLYGNCNMHRDIQTDLNTQ